jgi:hypothetical protein
MKEIIAIDASFINTQLQLGEGKASGAPLNRFNGFADDAAQTVETVRMQHRPGAPH